MITATESNRQNGSVADNEISAAATLNRQSERLVVHDDGPNANLFDTARFEQCQRIAQAMASMSILPDHLKIDSKTKQPLDKQQVVANCFRIVNQAIRWGFDPFAIIDETYVVAGKLGYGGKLIAAVVNTRAGLKGRLSYEFSGSGADLMITVRGTFSDGDTKEIAVRLGDVKTENQMWSKDPRQKLVYTAATKWARRWCPEVVLGVMTDDDLERIEAEKPKLTTERRKTRLPIDDAFTPLSEEEEIRQAVAKCMTAKDVVGVCTILEKQHPEKIEFIQDCGVAREEEIRAFSNPETIEAAAASQFAQCTSVAAVAKVQMQLTQAFPESEDVLRSLADKRKAELK